MPCFIKSHYYGEYVFDWAWADAYHKYCHHYYPKLVAAIPFTPATGPRLGFSTSVQSTQQKLSVIKFIDKAIRDNFNSLKLSSWHVLFPQAELSTLLDKSGWQQRIGIQYHWFNRQYNDFV